MSTKQTYRGSMALQGHLSDLTGNAVKVYTALAMTADREGIAQPSIAELSGVTGLSPRTVQRAISDLLGVSLVTRLSYASGHSPARYQLAIGVTPVTPQEEEPRQNGKPPGRGKFAKRLDESDSIRTY